VQLQQPLVHLVLEVLYEHRKVGVLRQHTPHPRVEVLRHRFVLEQLLQPVGGDGGPLLLAAAGGLQLLRRAGLVCLDLDALLQELLQLRLGFRHGAAEPGELRVFLIFWLLSHARTMRYLPPLCLITAM
jgi:hypothetical protein